MTEKSPIPMERGQQILALLKTSDNLKGSVRRNVTITNEEGEKSHWDSFVTFPPELSKAFPGSYVSPDLFLSQFGFEKKERDEKNRNILGRKIGTIDDPALHIIDEGFEVTILNGLGNPHAQAMTRLAHTGFNDSFIRAQYQQEMFEGIKSALEKKQEPTYGIRIHDDCLASGDSVISYLWRRMEENLETVKGGVEVLIDGPATAQSLLLIKAFAKEHKMNIHVTAAHMAFGLTEGVEINGVRKHANYITYPDALLELLDPDVRHEVESNRGENGIIQVVGDMGDAEQGIDHEEMLEIRRESGNDHLCSWNEDRKDPHGKHPNRQDKLEISSYQGKPEDVYFARGGYLPYALDEKYNPNFDKTRKIVERASRIWSKEYGYGAGFREA